MGAVKQWQLEKAELDALTEEIGGLCDRAMELRSCPICLGRQFVSMGLKLLTQYHTEAEVVPPRPTAEHHH